jgi:hypothetical protein
VPLWQRITCLTPTSPICFFYRGVEKTLRPNFRFFWRVVEIRVCLWCRLNRFLMTGSNSNFTLSGTVLMIARPVVATQSNDPKLSGAVLSMYSKYRSPGLAVSECMSGMGSSIHASLCLRISASGVVRVIPTQPTVKTHHSACSHCLCITF